MPRQDPQPMTAADLPRRMQAVRLQAGLTCRELARRLDVHASTVSHWERGRQTISRRTVLAINTVCRNARQSRRRANGRMAGQVDGHGRSLVPFSTVLSANDAGPGAG